MALIDIALPLLLIIIFVLIAIFIIRSAMYLIINAIIGLITLFIVNYFHLMQYFGKPDIGYDLVTVIICALGGIFGAVIVIVLAIIGIPV